MSNNQDSSLNIRIQNAKEITARITASHIYEKIDPAQINSYQQILKETEICWSVTLNASKAFTDAVHERHLLFVKGEDSVFRTMNRIISYLRNAFGKTSTQVSEVSVMNTIIKQCRTPKPTQNATERSVILSELTHNNILHTFSDVLELLESYGNEYAPANRTIQKHILRSKLNLCIQANASVKANFVSMRKLKDVRANKYHLLKVQTKRLKEKVKAIYGIQSAEYNQIRNIRV